MPYAVKYTILFFLMIIRVLINFTLSSSQKGSDNQDLWTSTKIRFPFNVQILIFSIQVTMTKIIHEVYKFQNICFHLNKGTLVSKKLPTIRSNSSHHIYLHRKPWLLSSSLMAEMKDLFFPVYDDVKPPSFRGGKQLQGQC